MRRKGFTLIELLVVMSIIIVLMSILLPCLIVAKNRALELFTMHTEPDEEGKVMLEIRRLSYRKLTEDRYMIELDAPADSRVSIKKPYPSGMKLIYRDQTYFIKWRPKVSDIGIHPVTVVFECEKTTEQQMTVYVYNKKLLEEKQESQSNAD